MSNLENVRLARCKITLSELNELEKSLPKWNAKIMVDAEIGKAASDQAAADKIEREAALWAFERGGTVTVRSYVPSDFMGVADAAHSVCKSIKDPSSLPEGFRLAAGHLQDKEVSDDDLELLSKCKF